MPGAYSRPASRASGYARTSGILLSRVDKFTSAAGLISTFTNSHRIHETLLTIHNDHTVRIPTALSLQVKSAQLIKAVLLNHKCWYIRLGSFIYHVDRLALGIRCGKCMFRSYVRAFFISPACSSMQEIFSEGLCQAGTVPVQHLLAARSIMWHSTPENC